LLKSILVHQAEVTNLKQIIEKKDAEIEQYKLEGAMLIRSKRGVEIGQICCKKFVEFEKNHINS
jgi:hypothetical protein